MKLLTDDFTRNDLFGFSSIGGGLSWTDLFIGNAAKKSSKSDTFISCSCGWASAGSVIKIKLNEIKFYHNRPSFTPIMSSVWPSASIFEWLVSLSKNDQRTI